MALSPTARTRLGRLGERAAADRTALFDVLDSAFVCHLGVVVGEHPLVIPTVFAYDPDGPDPAGTLYVHGSVGAQTLRKAPDRDVCVTVTSLDGLVLARSAFHHSMNYRSAVVLGRPRPVDDPREKRHALDLIVDHVVPGRAAALRDHTRRELAATAVVALPLREASVKTRTGDPVDDPGDIAAGGWAGVVPIRVSAGPIRPSPDADGVPTPAEVLARVAGLT